MKPLKTSLLSSAFCLFWAQVPLSAEDRTADSELAPSVGIDADSTGLCNATAANDTSSADLDDIQDGFRATGYINTIVCDPKDATQNTQILSGNYTRWVVTPGPVFLDDGQRLYSLEGRSWLAKLFTDRVIETSHSLNIEMAAPTVSFPIPLSTFKYNEEGENGTEYSTSLRNHGFDQTYFRVNPNTTMNIQATAQHSFRTSFGGAVDVLNAVTDAVKLVSPSSTLLTSINADQVTKTSNAINQIAGSMFDNRYDETVEDGFSTETWYENRRVLVLIQLPFEITSHDRNPNGNSDTPIYLSYWLSLACPRQSMFSTQDLCGRGNSADPNTGSILAFEMAANKTVQQFLSDQQWYKDFLVSDVFRDAPNANDTAARDALLLRFCRSIANGVYGAGFNAKDTRLIVGAAIDGMPELTPVAAALRTSCDATEADRTTREFGLRAFPEVGGQ